MKVGGDHATRYPSALKTSPNSFQKAKEVTTAWTGPVWEVASSPLPSHAAIAGDQVRVRMNRCVGACGILVKLVIKITARLGAASFS